MIEDRRAKGAKGFNIAAERMRLSNLREYEAGRGNAEAVARCAAMPPVCLLACGTAVERGDLRCTEFDGNNLHAGSVLTLSLTIPRGESKPLMS